MQYFGREFRILFRCMSEKSNAQWDKKIETATCVAIASGRLHNKRISGVKAQLVLVERRQSNDVPPRSLLKLLTGGRPNCRLRTAH
jgi:hypothetical protein